MRNIKVISMGPGAREYLLPAALKAIAESDVIFGGTRLLQGIDTAGKEVIFFGKDWDQTCREIRCRENRKIAVLVSGDAGFHSFLHRLAEEIGRQRLTVIPGISSLHYLLAAIGFSWEDTAFISLHGQSPDLISVVRQHRKTAILTDNKNTPQAIATLLTAHGLGELELYIGNRLSYADEEIIHDQAKNIAVLEKGFDLAVMVVVNV